MSRSPEPPRRSVLSVLAPILTSLALIAFTAAVLPALTAPATPRAALEPMTFSLAVAPSLRTCARGGCHDASGPAPRMDGLARDDERSRRAVFEAVGRFVTPGDAAQSELYRRALGAGACGAAAMAPSGCEARALRDWIDGRAVRRCAGR